MLLVGLTLFYFTNLVYSDLDNLIDKDVVKTHHYAIWTDGVVPFYVDPEHFDHEQTLSIRTTLSLFAFKTCLKFVPVLDRPTGSQHTMVFENPKGVRKCVFNIDGHPTEEPHKVILGYDCLKSPQIDMMVMRALGFPFEHNRSIREMYIDVQFQNIETGALELYTQDAKLPPELHALPYDVNSVMHFGDRDFSKNGHRTILFKDYNVQQNRKGLSDLDLRKIEIVYGPECQKRDRQEKIKLCQNYPEVARKKRDVDFIINGSSLRINREITAPPGKTLTKDETNTLLELGIGKEVKEIMDRVYKVSSIALMNTRAKYCNDTKPNLRSNTNSNEKVADMLGIVKTVTKYVQSIVDDAIKNQKEFCEMYKSLDQYQRDSYRTTRSDRVQHLTQYRPTIFQGTKHHSKGVKNQHDRIVYRTGNDTDKEVTKARRKRAVESITKAVASKGESDITWVRRKRAVNFASEIEGINTNVQSDDIKVRNKRSAATEAVTKVIEPKGSTGNQSLNKEQKPTESVKLTNKDLTTAPNLNERTTVAKTSPKINDGKTNMKSLGRRRFQDSPFRVYNRKKNNEEKDESDLSLEAKQEAIIAKQVKPIKKNYLPQNKKKPIKNWSEVKRAQRKSNGPVPKTVKLSKANEEFYADRRWPDGVVRYIIKEIPKYDLDDLRSRLEEVNRILKDETCVRLEEITSGETSLYNDYLVLDNSPDYVTGRVGGRQNFGVVELFEGGQHRQHTAMMVMAMLGFYFEPSRHDRDRYVRVHPRHIRPDKLHHFEKLRPDATLPLPYDYRSATHPAWQFWRQLGRTGISAVATYKDQDPDGSIMKSLGHNSKLLSDLDIIKINSVYGVKCFL